MKSAGVQLTESYEIREIVLQSAKAKPLARVRVNLFFYLI